MTDDVQQSDESAKRRRVAAKGSSGAFVFS
jgi:hypothetical protein